MSLPDIPFHISLHPQKFCLLELPPELIEYLDHASSSPSKTLLEIKSALPPSSSECSSQNSCFGPFAVLCTSDQTFKIRQVQTSNSLFLACPCGPYQSPIYSPTPCDSANYSKLPHATPPPKTSTSHHTHHIDQKDNLSPDIYLYDGLCATARLTSTLEAVPVSPNLALSYLRRSLPIWSFEENLTQDITNAPREPELTATLNTYKSCCPAATLLFPDIPFSNRECHNALANLPAFIPFPPPPSGIVYVTPTPTTCIKLWDSMLRASKVISTDFFINPFPLKSLWENLTYEYDLNLSNSLRDPSSFTCDELSIEMRNRLSIFLAIIRCICKQDSNPLSSPQCINVTLDSHISVDALRCVQWIGITMLEEYAMSGQSHLSYLSHHFDFFLSTWKQRCPEPWRKFTQPRNLLTRLGHILPPSSTSLPSSSTSPSPDESQLLSSQFLLAMSIVRNYLIPLPSSPLLAPSHPSAPSASSTSSSGTVKPPGNSSGDKRKWHEQLGAGRQFI